ncbi:MAG: type IX secretion system membrane protein PorP/SprF [Bacteroidia bacterium]
MKHIYKLIFPLALLLYCTTTQAQNQLHLSQYMLYQPMLNPASVASYNNLNGALLYRKQWVGFTGAPTVQGISFNAPLKGKKHFVGFTLFNDKISVNKRLDFVATYAYRLPLNDRSSLSFGLSAGIGTLQSNLSDVELVNPNDPVFAGNTQTFVAPQFKFGIYYFTKKFYAGFALPRLLDNKLIYEGDFKNKTNFSFKTMHYHLHVGRVFKLSDKFDLNTSLLMKQVSGSPMQLDINVQAVYNNLIGLGLSYRTAQIMVAMVNFRITKHFKVAYAYDIDMSPLKNVSSNSHEIMLIFHLFQEKAPVKIDAPRF